ncbi:MAG: class I SAM-dependent methyltransferase family protein [Candidatus Nanohaloarchaea archaeon]
MEQEELERYVRELFTEQGMEVSESENLFEVPEANLRYQVFSSEKYSVDEAEKNALKGCKIFVDPGLEDLEERFEEVSVIEEEGEHMETPSYEVIGDIAVISELPDMDEDEAVEAITEHHPHVKTVLLKEGGLKGEFRVGDYRILYGSETGTTHTEFGCDFRVDPTEAYYSERFSTERERVVSQIEEGEDVLVMFAGVGPFAVMAAKNASPSSVVGIEKNPEAAEYFRENVALNDVEETVDVIEGDAGKELKDRGRFDRIVMPLPGSADEFLEEAFRHTRPGGVIHYYRFIEDGNWEPVVEELREASSETGRSFEVRNKVICGNRGPSVDRICIDTLIN